MIAILTFLSRGGPWLPFHLSLQRENDWNGSAVFLRLIEFSCRFLTAAKKMDTRPLADVGFLRGKSGNVSPKKFLNNCIRVAVSAISALFLALKFTN